MYKNYKRFFPLWIILINSIFCSKMAAMEESHFEICKQIKNISPEASPREYSSLAMRLRDAGLSVCECIRNLCERRIEKAKHAIEKEWGVTQHDWDAIEKKVESLTAQDQHEKLIISVDPKLQELQEGIGELIWQKLYEAGCKGTFNLTYASPKIDETGLSRSFDVYVNRYIEAKEHPFDYDNKRVKYEIITAGDFEIEIGPRFFEYSPKEQEGCLLHEIRGHVVHNDSVRGGLLSTSACIYKPELLQDRLPFRKSDSVLKRFKAIEARADQIPAACMTAHEARLIEAWHASNLEQISHDVDNYRHDLTTERLAMAKRIRKLKEAEEQLNIQ